jgi:two-component system chemotaxis response regulator CheY
MKNFLVVDDSRVIRNVARRILEALNFKVSEAADGQQALDACKAEFPDAILLDWNMPVMDGIQFLRALRALPGGEAPVGCSARPKPNSPRFKPRSRRGRTNTS